VAVTRLTPKWANRVHSHGLTDHALQFARMHAGRRVRFIFIVHATHSDRLKLEDLMKPLEFFAILVGSSRETEEKELAFFFFFLNVFNATVEGATP